MNPSNPTLPAAAPGAGELLVHVRAAGVRPHGDRSEGAEGPRHALPVALRSGVAGIVEAVPDASAGFAVGDAVFGVTTPRLLRGQDAYALVSANRVARMPRRLDFEEAAVMPVVAVSAWQMLFKVGRPDAGETVVVLGAQSPVGAFALQFARIHGVRAVAVSASKNECALKALGAARVIDASPGRLEVECARAAVVIDTAGGAVQRRASAALGSGGVIVSCVARPDMAFASVGTRGLFFVADVTTCCLARIAELIDGGVVRTDFEDGLAWTEFAGHTRRH
jgi:NADPH:quinone reductase-like Zn-dependent oxidoreductase